jgi:hypothetical protein
VRFNPRSYAVAAGASLAARSEGLANSLHLKQRKVAHGIAMDGNEVNERSRRNAAELSRHADDLGVDLRRGSLLPAGKLK